LAAAVRAIKDTAAAPKLSHFSYLQTFIDQSTGSDIDELLSLFSLDAGGLTPLATGLFQQSWEMRRKTVFILRKLSWHRVL
jgi:hypothetical protein